MSQNAKRLLDKLEKYEQEAYDGNFGSDWLEQLGEGFKFYVKKCFEKGLPVTIKGWEEHIDGMHSGTIIDGNYK